MRLHPYSSFCWGQVLGSQQMIVSGCLVWLRGIIFLHEVGASIQAQFRGGNKPGANTSSVLGDTPRHANKQTYVSSRETTYTAAKLSWQMLLKTGASGTTRPIISHVGATCPASFGPMWYVAIASHLPLRAYWGLALEHATILPIGAPRKGFKD